ncbi:MAG: hypothetical protein HY775_11195 [Acidobacteria bacterium]|nr:hypothetical protein [Acidobacteriota bacterium]
MDEIRLWLGATSPPKYRVGIRAGAASAPSDAWLNEVKVGGVVISGAFADASFADASFPTGVSVTVPSTSLAAGQYYWVVVEAAPVLSPLDKQPGPSNWIALQSVGADPGAEGSMAVLDRSGAAWASSTGQVPRMVLRSAGGTMFSQELAPISPLPATEYSVPGELFVADRDMQPTDARVLLAKVGSPAGGVTMRLLDPAGSELWSADVASPVVGWTQVPVSGVTLHAGTSYRFIVDAPSRDVAVETAWSYWSGSAWVVLPTTRNTIGEGRAGEAALTPPSDWAPTSVDGRPAYWAKLTSTAGQATPISVDRLTKIRNLFAPSVPAQVQGYVPLVYSAGGAAPGVEFATDPTAVAFPATSRHLSDNFCLSASSGPNDLLEGHFTVIGDTNDDGYCGASSSPYPVSVSPSMTPGENRYIYGTLDATRPDSDSDGYYQVSSGICRTGSSSRGITTHENNWGERIETVRFLYTVPSTGTTTCALRARVRNLASHADTYLTATPTNDYTYIKVVEGDKIGAEQWTEGTQGILPDVPGGDVALSGSDGIMIWPGTSYDALAHTWAGVGTAAAMNVIGDVELTDCHYYCKAGENGTWYASATVTTELRIAEQSTLDSALHCDLFTNRQTEVITAQEHHVKLVHTLTKSFNKQYCTGVVDIRVRISVGSGSNPVKFHPGLSLGIAMNSMG